LSQSAAQPQGPAFDGRTGSLDTPDDIDISL
jgi:hypothetical protein